LDFNGRDGRRREAGEAPFQSLFSWILTSMVLESI